MNWQVIPEVAKVVGQLYVFQRTPSTIDIRNNTRTSERNYKRFRETAGWALARLYFQAIALVPKPGTEIQESTSKIWVKGVRL